MSIREKIAARQSERETEARQGLDKVDRAIIRAGAIIIAGQIIGAIIGHILTRG